MFISLVLILFKNIKDSPSTFNMCLSLSHHDSLLQSSAVFWNLFIYSVKSHPFLQWNAHREILSLSLSVTGLFNTAFTQYVVEEPTAITSVVNTAAMAATGSLKKEQTPQPQTPAPTSAKVDMKETSL